MILEILGSTVIGNVIGGLMAWLNKGREIEQKRVDFAHELELRRVDLEIAKAESESKERIAVVEGDAAVDVARMNAIAAANQSDRVTAENLNAAGKLRWLYVLMDAWRVAMRPGLTTVYSAVALYITAWMAYVLIQSLGPDQISLIRTMVKPALEALFAQAGMMTGYWFVSRGPASGSRSP